MIGWSVAGLLALGAALAGGTHALAAAIPALCLFAASMLCLFGILSRSFSGVPGYAPAVLLADTSTSEYEALVSLAKGYQISVERNATAFRRFKRLLAVAIVMLALAPLAGLAAWFVVPGTAISRAPHIIPVRAAPA
jgi:hypothetical protein